MKNKVVIKKYSDRRLYDTAASRYVTLDDIARMIREGSEVEVRDIRTGKDITSAILTQIVMEDAREGETVLPLQLLQQMIRASDRATRDLYLKARESLSSGLSDARQAVTNPLGFVRNILGPDEEVEQLRRRVEELEARLAEATRAKRSRRPAPKRPEKK